MRPQLQIYAGNTVPKSTGRSGQLNCLIWSHVSSRTVNTKTPTVVPKATACSR